jgi:hypothetical protein
MFKHIECTKLGNLKSILVTGTLALSLRHHCHVLRVEEWMSHKLEPEGGGLPMSKTTLANCGWKSI